ncbi:CopG family transcriptional regulator [Candidatus Poriferisodalis sp.]|uniref:CopG family transcriptional regulator n=1 Tax=Candidatus Poriferisodalis sp. TaxID=3101277 RepID=UPI003B5A11B2
MSADAMTPAEEFEFYSQPENQVPRGPPRRRSATLSDPVTVRFSRQVLEQVKAAAAAEDRSVSSWVRRAVDSALQASSA